MTQEEDEQIQPVSRNFASLDRILNHLSNEMIQKSTPNINRNIFMNEILSGGYKTDYVNLEKLREAREKVGASELEGFFWKIKLRKVLDECNWHTNPSIPVFTIKDAFAFLNPLTQTFTEKERLEAMREFVGVTIAHCLSEQIEKTNALHQYNTIWLGAKIHTFLSNFFPYPGSDSTYLDRIVQTYRLTPVRKEELHELVVIFENDRANMTEPDNILWLFDRTRLFKPMSAMILIKEDKIPRHFLA